MKPYGTFLSLTGNSMDGPEEHGASKAFWSKIWVSDFKEIFSRIHPSGVVLKAVPPTPTSIYTTWELVRITLEPTPIVSEILEVGSINMYFK